jgi:NitT/TauT family transport system permease protein
MKEALSEVGPVPAEVQAPARAGRGAIPELFISAGYYALSLVLLLGAWTLLSRLVSVNIVPTPAMTYHAFLRALEDQNVWSDIAVTLKRTLGAFGLAMLLGTVIGAMLGSLPTFRRVFALWLFIAASIPSLLYLVVVYLMVGLNDTAAIVGGALVVGPSITFNVWQGMKSLDPRLSEMARAFRVGRRTILWRVLLPQTVPFLFAAARIGLALTWKIIIFVELLGRSSGVGYRIQYWYQLVNMERVLAAALPFVALMLLLELVVLRNLEAYLFRWRREEAR